MNRLTIINGNAGDDAVVIDGRAQYFPVDALLNDSKIWAVQWEDGAGWVEYRDNTQKGIDSLDEFQPVIDEFNRLCEVEDNPPLPTAEQLQEIENAEARFYLSNTDWYVIRQQETGEAIPAEILAERAAARERVLAL